MTLEEIAAWVQDSTVVIFGAEREPAFVGPKSADFECSTADGTRFEVSVRLVR
jgi:hypothetical protein